MADLLNIKTFQDIVDGDSETFLPILEDLELNGAELLEAISLEVKAGDLSKVRQAAHQLKGSTGMLGLERVYDLCINMETLELSDINEVFQEELRSAFRDGLALAKENV